MGVYTYPAALASGATVGVGGGTARLGGVIGPRLAAPATTTGTAIETVYTATIPANTLTANGQMLRVVAWGKSIATLNSRTLGVYFGSGAGQDMGSITAANNAVTLHAVEVWIMRTGDDDAESWRRLQHEAFVGGTPDVHSIGGVTISNSVNATWANPLNVNIRLTTPTAAGDLTLVGVVVELLS